MDLLDRNLFDHYLLANRLGRGRRHQFQSGRGSSTIEHFVGGSLLMDHLPTDLRCQSLRLLPLTPPSNRMNLKDLLLDKFPADKKTRLGDLRLDNALDQQHCRRQVHNGTRQRQGAQLEESRASHSWTPRR